MNTPALEVFPEVRDLAPDQRARIFEQLTSQELRWLGSGPGDPERLFYWHREGGRAGEVDHMAQLNGRILPIELKSGAAGSMKSLHQFMFDKNLQQAVRMDTNPPSVFEVDVRTTQGDRVSYQLVSLPLYLLWDLQRITQRAWDMRKP